MKKIAIYVYHNQNKVVENFAVFFVKSFLEIVSEVVVVINGDLDEGEIKKFQFDRVKTIQRPNAGYDAHAYREGVLAIEDSLSEADLLVFANSSIYGPIFPISEIFDKMQNTKGDFWGATIHPKAYRKVFKLRPDAKIEEHVQSYFMVFKKNVFSNEAFLNYFKNLRQIKNKKDAIKHFEIYLTLLLKKAGFKYDSYIPREIFKLNTPNVSQYLPDVLIENYRFPFIKRTIFYPAQDEAQEKLQHKILDFVKQHTRYDVNLITDDISKNCPEPAKQNACGKIKKLIKRKFQWLFYQ